MTDFKQQYKNKGFGDTEQQRILRAYKWDKSRKEIRSQTFDRNRRLLNISPSTTPQTGKFKQNFNIYCLAIIQFGYIILYYL